MVNGSFGRSKGIYKWRKGWRADVLKGAVERREVRRLSLVTRDPLGKGRVRITACVISVDRQRNGRTLAHKTRVRREEKERKKA